MTEERQADFERRMVTDYSTLPPGYLAEVQRRMSEADESPAELRRRADLLESQECTGVAASWCPIHDTCRCPRDENGVAESLDHPDCPLHSPDSAHAAASVAACQEG